MSQLTELRSNRSIHITWPTSLCLDPLVKEPENCHSATPISRNPGVLVSFESHLSYLTVSDSSVVKQLAGQSHRGYSGDSGASTCSTIGRYILAVVLGELWQKSTSKSVEQLCLSYFELCQFHLRRIAFLRRIEPHLLATGMASR